MEGVKLYIILLFVIVVILFAQSIHAEEDYFHETCLGVHESLGVGGLCIEVDFETVPDNTTDVPDERYSFPYYTKQGDHLFIKKFYAINLAEKELPEVEFDFLLKPLDYQNLDPDLRDIYFDDYGKWRLYLPKLAPREYVLLNYSGDGIYSKSGTGDWDNFRFDLHRIELYKEGEWVINEAYKWNSKEDKGYTSILQGKWKGNVFQVNSPFEITTLIDVKESIKYAKYAFWIAVILLVLEIKLHYKELKKN